MKITLALKNDVWNATYSGAGSQEIIELFGCATIPTPYTKQSSSMRVLNDITRLNPNALVVLK